MIARKNQAYAETFAERWRGIPGHPYEQGFDLRLVPEKLAEPLGWGRPRKVFVNSMSDLFHPDVPDAYIRLVFESMRLADWHIFQILTKRGQRLLSLAETQLADFGAATRTSRARTPRPAARRPDSGGDR